MPKVGAVRKRAVMGAEVAALGELLVDAESGNNLHGDFFKPKSPLECFEGEVTPPPSPTMELGLS